jgi:hypothetical protein
MSSDQFHGVAATKAIKKPSKREQFTVHICAPHPRTSLTNEQAVVQRRIVEEHKRQQELDKFYEETARRNDEEQRKILEEIAEKERLDKERKALEAAEYEVRLQREQPKRCAMRLFPTRPRHPVYYMDTNYNMCLLWGPSTKNQDQQFNPSSKPYSHPIVYDELRDDIWPTLAKLTVVQKELRAKLYKLNQKLDTVKPFAKAAYQQSILQTFVAFHLTNQRIRLVSIRQSKLMDASSKKETLPHH